MRSKSLLSGERPSLSGTNTFTLEDSTDLIPRSGFPGFRDLSLRSVNEHLDTYLERLVNVDIREAGTVVRQPETLMRCLRSYAASVATTCLDSGGTGNYTAGRNVPRGAVRVARSVQPVHLLRRKLRPVEALAYLERPRSGLHSG